MKKSLIALSCVMLLATGCQKETLKQETNAVVTEADQFTWVDASGNDISRDNVDFASDEAVLFVEYTDKSQTAIQVKVFETEQDVLTYVSQDSKYGEVVKSMEQTRAIRELAIATGDINLTAEEMEAGMYSAEMKKLFAKYEVAAQNQEKGVGFLFDGPNANGAAFFLSGVPMPSLGGFRNRASSAAGAGIFNRIWARRWFRGFSVYLFLGTGPTIPLNGLGIDNDAESAW